MRAGQMNRMVWGVVGIALLAAWGCGDDNNSNNSSPTLTEAEQRAVVEQYAAIVEASYGESLTKAQTLQGSIDTFVAAPSESGFTAARQAWLDAREPYGQTEVYRFYGGPIDDEDGPEGQINAWPLDENYIDYVDGNETSGLINGAETLTEALLKEANEKDGEKNISTGYHSIEFLLWGQDLSADGPGARPYTDYVPDTGTAANQARRGEYLKLSATVLVADLQSVHDEWKAGVDGNYRASFVAADPKDSIAKILTGMGSLSGAELAGERMEVALVARDQEDEHSCFSDNTHRDIVTNALGIQNAYLGRYGSNDGPGIDDLVEKLDPALNAKLKAQLQASVDAANAIPAPFDQALLNADGQAKIEAAIDALRDQTTTIVEVATLLGITLNLEE